MGELLGTGHVDAVVAAIPAVLDKLRTQLGTKRFDSGNFTLAAQMFADMTRAAEFPEFLTTVAYEYID